MLDTERLEPFTKLDRDLKKAAQTLTDNEARYLVDAYYAIQGYRIRFGNQIRALSESGEPHEVIRWMFANAEGLENNIKSALNSYSRARTPGIWARSVPGIGPVLASGLLAHIDINQAPTVGHIWSYCGYNPTARWEKGQKRPWNADLKRICYLIGESFIKVQNNPRDHYGKIYVTRKKLEQEANDFFFYADQAAATLQSKRFGKDTEAFKHYSVGKLSPAHVHARARRYAVKFFLAHLQEVWYELETGKKPPNPFVMEHLGHVDLIKPPNWPMEDEVNLTEEEVAQAPVELWPTDESRVMPPRQVLYLTLEAQLLAFKEVLEKIEALALESPAAAWKEALPKVVEGFVPAAVRPTLQERLERYKARQQPGS